MIPNILLSYYFNRHRMLVVVICQKLYISGILLTNHMIQSMICLKTETCQMKQNKHAMTNEIIDIITLQAQPYIQRTS